MGRQKGEGDPPATPARKRILVVDDHPVLRKGVAALVASSPDLELCGDASTAAEALCAVERCCPDAVIVDISIPGMGGVELLHQLRALHPHLPLLVYSIHDERVYAERALRAGAQGYVMKHEPPERVLEGLRAVLRGEIFVSEALQKTLLAAFLAPGRNSVERQGIDRLSDRELQVFEAIGRGHTTLQIARELHLSVKTIETYRSNIKHKLGLENGHQLIHAAVRWMESGATPRGAGAGDTPREDGRKLR